MSSDSSADAGGRIVGRARGRISRDRDDRPGRDSKRVRRESRPSQDERPPMVEDASKGELGRERQESTDSRPASVTSHTSGGESRAQTQQKFVYKKRQLKSDVAITRPDYLKDKRGISGMKIPLQANYFNLRSLKDWKLFQYHVHFDPEEDRPGIRKALVKQHKEVLGPYIFDGSMLFVTSKLAEEFLEVKSIRQGDSAEIALGINFTKQLGLGDVEYLQFFNILMRKCLGALKLQLVGRHFFDPVSKIPINKFKLELWPGYMTSIREHEHGILMCAEITHKVMRLETVQDVFIQCQNKCHSVHEFRQHFKSSVLGLVVLTDYNNRTYRVDDVNFELTPKSTFPLRDRMVSYADYYNERYQIRIRNMYQPLLISKSKSHKMKVGTTDTVYLVPELCRMTGLSDDMRTNFQLMRAVAEYTRVGPHTRIEKLLSFSRRLKGAEDVKKEMDQYDMEMSSRLVEIEGRRLDPESIVQGYAGRDIVHEAGLKADWTQSLRANPLLHLRKLQQWIVVCPKNLQNDMHKFINLVIQAANGMSMCISEPQIEYINDDRRGTYVNTLDDLLSSFNPQLVLCIVPNNHTERYSAIKKKCLVERSVPTQILTGKSLSNRGAMSIATKVAIQMNCKIGGAPWTVLSSCKSEMVVGFDVSHNSKDKRISYGALVASMDRTFSRWFSAVSIHGSPEELSDNISANLLKALQQFRKNNEGNLPARIIVYRDGVGEGQIDYVCKVEVDTMKARLIQLYGSEDRFRLTFIIVCKRINTRIFLGNSENPQPGTVVDDCITLPERYDFFLVSQSVRQGTVSPTSYNVVYDTSGYTPDQMQKLTYKMTHLYYNWSGTVRVPAPVQYAHKLAMLVGQSLHGIPGEALNDTLYFL